jgi:hypothetical protein
MAVEVLDSKIDCDYDKYQHVIFLAHKCTEHYKPTIKKWYYDLKQNQLGYDKLKEAVDSGMYDISDEEFNKIASIYYPYAKLAITIDDIIQSIIDLDMDDHLYLSLKLILENDVLFAIGKCIVKSELRRYVKEIKEREDDKADENTDSYMSTSRAAQCMPSMNESIPYRYRKRIIMPKNEE